MIKIIAAFDGLRLSESTLHYCTELGKVAGAHIVGIFLDDLLSHSYSYKKIVAYQGENLDRELDKWKQKDQETRDESAFVFEKLMQREGIQYSIHRDKDVAMQELLHESIYADLLIINSSETFNRYQEKRPSRFIRELLAEVQCSVLLVPSEYKPIEGVRLLYNGEPSSVAAVKTFSYLLPEYKKFETQVVSIKSQNDTMHLPDNKLMKEFMKRHYPKAVYNILKGYAEDEIINFLAREKKHSIVVLGAYRRSKVSRWFRPSMADYLMQELELPLFIAHS